MPKTNFQEYVCRPYCVFFKDGIKEELACRGAEVVERLVNAKRLAIREIPPLEKEPVTWKAAKEELGQPVCGRCSFRAEDCDFQAVHPPDDAEPCGGFILLAHVRQMNLISAADLEDSGAE
jgi:hypothetical protein